jgi:hypothetical protein
VNKAFTKEERRAHARAGGADRQRDRGEEAPTVTAIAYDA